MIDCESGPSILGHNTQVRNLLMVVWCV